MQSFASATLLMRSQSFPPSEIKSLYGSMRRRAVASLSNDRFVMFFPPAFAEVCAEIVSRPACCAAFSRFISFHIFFLAYKFRRSRKTCVSQGMSLDAFGKQRSLLPVVRLGHGLASGLKDLPWNALHCQRVQEIRRE